jgi:hypothetical protein
MTDDIPMKTLIQETLDCMAIHEKTVEYADCILWDAATGDSGHPIYKPVGRCCTLVRRDVFRLCGNDLKPRVPIDTRCGEKCCLNPKHLFESTTSAVAIRAGQRGAFSSFARRAKIAASRRGKMKLNIEQAREIRMSDESGPVLAVKYGVNRSLINNIKRNRAWRDYSNPFAGLMA